ncbi:hypothetical protein HK105_204258 [Polyrhizophydium stewartii]|uniref:SUN domain-containing protein n=1 Tax=Polyrhizophydium stewartii TaxID=2732419 RepID=A0ABR4N9I2_9FUNG
MSEAASSSPSPSPSTPAPPPAASPQSSSRASRPGSSAASKPSAAPVATGKSDKERFNYASFDCGALIRAANREASSATAILSNSKDQYMLNKCASKKFVEIELCDDILVDSLVLANLEYFSSMFKDFRVFVADRYPPKRETGWRLVGQFTAKNVRERQAFSIENPVLWARYLRVEFLTHYGHEFYCPLTMLKVFGTSMIEDVKTAEEDLELDTPVPHPTDGAISETDRTERNNEAAREKSMDSPKQPFEFNAPPSSKSDAPSSPSPASVTSPAMTPTPASARQTPGQSAPVHDSRPPTAAPESDASPPSSYTVNGQPSPQQTANADSRAAQPTPSAHNPAPGVQHGGSPPRERDAPSQPPDLGLDGSGEPLDASHSGGEMGEHDSAEPSSGRSSAPATPGPGATSGNGHAQQPLSGTRESIFKNIVKRLLVLERNTTAQSKIIDDIARATDSALAAIQYEQQRQIDAKLANCQAVFDREFDSMAARLRQLLDSIESKTKLLEEKIAASDALIGALDDQINYRILSQVPVILLVLVGKYILQSILAALSHLLRPRSKRNGSGQSRAGVSGDSDNIEAQHEIGAAADLGMILGAESTGTPMPDLLLETRESTPPGDDDMSSGSAGQAHPPSHPITAQSPSKSKRRKKKHGASSAPSLHGGGIAAL